MGSGASSASGALRTETKESYHSNDEPKSGSGWPSMPFRNWLEWTTGSEKIQTFRPAVAFLNVLSSPNTSLPVYVRTIIDEVMRILNADRCSIFFVDDMRREVWCVGSLDMMPFNMPWDKGIVGMVATEGKLVNLQDAHSHPAFDPEIEKKTGYVVKGLISLPLKSTMNHEKTIGVIQVLNKRNSSGAFSEADLEELQKITMVVGDSFYRQRWKALESVFENNDTEVAAVLNQHRERTVGSSQSSRTPAMSSPPEILRSLSRQPFLRAHSPLSVDDLVSLNFDVLEQRESFLEELVPDILRHAGSIDACKIQEEKLGAWASTVHQGYRTNPFHNFYHGFGVYQMCFYQLSVLDTFSKISATQGFGMLVAALCHDIDHPGVTNSYLMKQQDDLALRYNDVSVLENHHAAVACTILRDGATNIAQGMDSAEQGIFRKTIIKCILATDMAHHQGLCQRLIGCVSAEDFQSTVTEDTQLLMNVCVHAADLSAQVLRWEVAKKWEDRICQEFTEQAAKEEELGFTPEPFMHFKMEDTKQRGKLQRDFIDFVLRPLWAARTKAELGNGD
ncbi:unnamed protein product [Effrenium voratum]|uniref:Phosphodiesterase n=1 Tax=Effrenium voratum TaxID=2562239 RepID=A0AA36J1Q5_9DINO|nr:unnamed protein product [Effrenium voratum]